MLPLKLEVLLFIKNEFLSAEIRHINKYILINLFIVSYLHIVNVETEK